MAEQRDGDAGIGAEAEVGGRVMNLRTTRGVVPAGGVRIDRKTCFGNPFVMRNHSEAERTRVINEHRAWLWQEIEGGRIALTDLAALAGKNLLCWCSPLPCHGDTLREAALWAQKKLLEEGK